ncbi:hypothetical protein BGZ61DRAFT_495682 [Ilyonectria robusta]|uniref:uncharacterized protein n=1 Tax=Ilyonectria robusta TaxID=1079257 RepID=UPI001E8CE8C0|nr:uncharacterized protein BGZ61DRAFT_495682 [Ilyonectria robusta]KAH8683997.1 hypothetical protein BGZ61DRAFT_495682 [Ilyonectria robusta]
MRLRFGSKLITSPISCVRYTQCTTSSNEGSPLQTIIVGRAEHSIFPAEPSHALEAIMPEEQVDLFRSNNPFSEDLLERLSESSKTLPLFWSSMASVSIAQKKDWLKVGSHTGSMPRDALMTVGNTLVESPFPWCCRRYEIHSSSARICRAPFIVGKDTIYDGVGDDAKHESNNNGNSSKWAINNGRPAFDTADFMRFEKTILGMFRYTTILPLRQGLLVYSPDRVTEQALRRHAVFKDWEIHAYSLTPKPGGPPIRPHTCDKFGMEPILLPIGQVDSIGGSFHWAAVDLVQSP